MRYGRRIYSPLVCAFWVFPSPLYGYTDSEGNERAIRALSWLTIERGMGDGNEGDAWVALEANTQRIALPTAYSRIQVSFYASDKDDDLRVPAVLDLPELRIGGSVLEARMTQVQHIAGGRAPTEKFLDVFLAALLFLRQKILVTAPASVPDQDAFRLRQRLRQPPSDRARIVYLRRRVYAESTCLGAEAQRHYSCQWLVSGHWRQQPYPSEGAVRPKWILPYVKGPSDKPLKAPTKTVYAVVR